MRSCWSIVSPKYYDAVHDSIGKYLMNLDARSLMVSHQDKHFKNVLIERNKHLHHLEIGCGTGVMFERSIYYNQLKENATIILSDIEQNALEIAKTRLNQFKNVCCLSDFDILDKKYVQQSLNEIGYGHQIGKTFDTIQLQQVLHCLPEHSIEYKLTNVLENLLPYFNDDTVIFGMFITNQMQQLNPIAKFIMEHGIKKGAIFVEDDGNDMIYCQEILNKYFNTSSVWNMNDNPFIVQFEATKLKM